jgi:uncharacterized protein (TIGR02145 family)
MNMKKIFAALALLLLASCQTDAPTGDDGAKTTTLSARVQLAAGVSTAFYDSAATVKVSLTAGSYSETQTPLFSAHGCDFTGVPIGVPYTLSFQGLNQSGTMIWSGTANGTTASSTTDGSVSATTVTVVVGAAVARDSTLTALSTTPGSFASTFARTTASYTDSVAAGVTSVTVTATANTSGDVSTITYNGQTSNVVTLNAIDPTTIPVVVTNRNGNRLIYTISIYHQWFNIPWNSAITYGLLTDPRDGKIYRTVTIGSQVWMAQNLNYRNTTGNTDTVGVCYGNAIDSCTKYGRLYTWAEVMAGSASSNANPSGVQGVCPSGWQVPSLADWNELIDTIQIDPRVGVGKEGTALKAHSGWDSGNGTDLFGMRVLPAMNMSYNGGIDPLLSGANFWTSNQGVTNAGGAMYKIFTTSSAITENMDAQGAGFSVRCVQKPAAVVIPSLDSIFPMDANTVGLWRMNEGAGTAIANAVGGTSGTLFGGATWVNGTYGKAVQFDGSSGYANLNFSPPQTNATFEAVVNIQQDTGWLFTLWGADNSGVALTSNGAIVPYFTNSFGNIQWILNKDIYLALTVDGNHTARLYVNGNLADTGTSSSVYSWSTITLASYTGTGGFVKCSFEKFRVSSAVRTAAEIAAIAQRAGLASSILTSSP